MPSDQIQTRSETLGPHFEGCGNLANSIRLPGLNGEHGNKAQISDVLDIRNAYKLGAKFFTGQAISIGESKLSLCEHAFDVGLILLLAGESRDLVVAGILHTAFQVQLQKERAHVSTTLRRKFGERVVDLINGVTLTEREAEESSWAMKQLTIPQLLTTRDREIATLLCAISIDLLASGNDVVSGRICRNSASEKASIDFRSLESSLDQQLEAFSKLKVNPILIAEFKAEARILFRLATGNIPNSFASDAPVLPSDRLAGLHIDSTLKNLHDIRLAAELSSKYFEAIPRKWGPTQFIPLSMHEFEVGILLALSGASRDVIIAGLLHDLFEGYLADHDLESLKVEVLELFGPNVLNLIECVTEPGRFAPGTEWWDRKLPVVAFIAAKGPDVATVACAAKISTLAAGNKMLYSGAPISEWSQGSLEDNIALFRMYRNLFESKGVSTLLLQQFDLELRRFEGFGFRAAV